MKIDITQITLNEEAGRAPLRSGTVPRTKEDLEIDELEDAFGGISEVSYTLRSVEVF